MVFEILLSIVITFGGTQGPTGGFNECPVSENEAVATSQNTESAADRGRTLKTQGG